MTFSDAGWLVFAIGSCYVAWRLHREAQTERLRFQLFVLRRELFDYAAAGHVAFDDETFVIAWTRINSLIRFAHRFSLFYVCLMSIPLSAQPSAANLQWEEALNRVQNPVVRQALSEMHFRRLGILIDHLVKGSLIGMLVVGVFHAWELAGRTAKFMRLAFAGRVYPVISRIDAVCIDDAGHAHFA